MEVSVKSDNFNISFELKHKFSVLIGDSAIGKTTLADLLNSNVPNVIINSTHEICVMNQRIFRDTLLPVKSIIRCKVKCCQKQTLQNIKNKELKC